MLLLNTDRSDSFTIAAGDRIAQLVLVRVETPEVAEVDRARGLRARRRRIRLERKLTPAQLCPAGSSPCASRNSFATLAGF